MYTALQAPLDTVCVNKQMNTHMTTAEEEGTGKNAYIFCVT
jgi:hypothetical protein